MRKIEITMKRDQQEPPNVVSQRVGRRVRAFYHMIRRLSSTFSYLSQHTKDSFDISSKKHSIERSVTKHKMQKKTVSPTRQK